MSKVQRASHIVRQELLEFIYNIDNDFLRSFQLGFIVGVPQFLACQAAVAIGYSIVNVI